MAQTNLWRVMGLGLTLVLTMVCPAAWAAAPDRAPSVVIIKRPRPAVPRVKKVKAEEVYASTTEICVD
jgi:hypothetical protein